MRFSLVGTFLASVVVPLAVATEPAHPRAALWLDPALVTRVESVKATSASGVTDQFKLEVGAALVPALTQAVTAAVGPVDSVATVPAAGTYDRVISLRLVQATGTTEYRTGGLELVARAEVVLKVAVEVSARDGRAPRTFTVSADANSSAGAFSGQVTVESFRRALAEATAPLAERLTRALAEKPGR